MKKVVIALLLLCLCGVGFVVLKQRNPSLHSKARKAWKERAISSLSQQTANPAGIEKDVLAMKSSMAADPESDKWISGSLIVMTNGEWLAYKSVCAKENERIADIFIARGSNQKWYYSTYHFCVGMLVVRDMSSQPGSLTNFISDFSLREFHGKSDVCLETTWPIRH